MSGVNVNISVSNLTQIDRHQDDIHRGPIINQQQNAQILKSEVARRIAMPVEPDPAEGKTIDSRDSLLNNKNRKRKKEKNGIGKQKKKCIRNSDGYFVDVQA